MKKKIKLQQTKTEEVELEVDFPVYRAQHFDDDSANYSRIELLEEDRPRFREVTICIRRRDDGSTEYRMDFDPDYEFDRSGLDYHLGRGQYASSEAEFCEALSRLKAAVNSIPV